VAIVRIDSPDDPRIEAYRAVSEPLLAHERGLFVAEGRLVVSRLIQDRRFEVHSLLITDVVAEALRQTLTMLDDEVPIFVVPAACLSDVAGVHIHRGCLALGVRPAPLALQTVMQDARTIVVLEDVGNPDNIGSVFRNAAAFGADAVLLTSACADPLYRKSIRTSMAASLQVPFARLPDGTDGLAVLRDAGLMSVAFATDATMTVQELAGIRSSQRLALIFGVESAGLTGQVMQGADLRVRIPIRTAVDSLNVGVAAGIALSWLTPSPLDNGQPANVSGATNSRASGERDSRHQR